MNNNPFGDYEEQWQDRQADLRREAEEDMPQKNFFGFSCSDRMCGATDCRRCHPEGNGQDNQDGEE